MRGYIDRKTGAVTAQVYHSASRVGGSPRFYRATYETPDGIKEVDAQPVGFDVSCQRYGCTNYEDAVFPIDYAMLQEAAKRYSPSEPLKGIRYRLFDRSGFNADEIIPANEIAAFVKVVERERGRLPH